LGFLSRLGLRQLIEPPLGVRAAYSLALLSKPAKVIMDFVAHNGAKPATEGIALSLLSKHSDVPQDGEKDFLADVGDILLLQLPVPAPIIDQWSVKRDEPVPRRGIAGFDAFQETPRRSLEGCATPPEWLFSLASLMTRGDLAAAYLLR
jgi:hypothetical protein